MGTVVTLLVGKIGSGKTTFLAWKAAENQEIRPSYPVVSNVPIKLPNVRYEDDILKFLAMKLIKNDQTQMDTLIDETAQAGLESRGSGMKATDSKLITNARKANVNMFLSTQLMSMPDKRLQWNYDYAILCDANYITEYASSRMIPDTFTYQVYNQSDTYQKTMTMQGDDFERLIIPLFDTKQIPLRAMLETEFKLYYWSKGKGEFDKDAFKADAEEFDAYIERYKGGNLEESTHERV